MKKINDRFSGKGSMPVFFRQFTFVSVLKAIYNRPITSDMLGFNSQFTDVRFPLFPVKGQFFIICLDAVAPKL